MSSIYVHLSRVKKANCGLPDVESGTQLVRKRIQRVKREIPDCISAKYQIGHRLNDICKEIDRLEAKMNNLYEITNICMEQYTYAESENSRNADAFY